MHDQHAEFDRQIERLTREGVELHARLVDLETRQQKSFTAALRDGSGEDRNALKQAQFEVEMRQRANAAELHRTRCMREETARAAAAGDEYHRSVSQWQAEREAADRRALDSYEAAPRDPYTRAVAEYRAQHGLG